MLPTIFVSGPDPTCFSTSIRTVSKSSPIFWRTLTATPCPWLDQAEQEMLGPDVIMVEAIGFFSGESQDPLGSRRKIIHWFGGSGVVPFSDSFTSLVTSGFSWNTRKRSQNDLGPQVVAFLWHFNFC